MSLLRQLPELYIRGSIANITMAGLTDEEREWAGKITERIVNHPDMQPKRRTIARKLADTIASDFRDDRVIADQEYTIGIWRGVVGILYHKKYDFHCRACGSSHWVTTRGIPKQIDRQYEFCPNCYCTLIETSGATDLVPGSYVIKEEFKKSCETISYVEINEHGWVGRDLPTNTSPIDFIPGERANDNPWKILNNNQQMVRFFGEYAWNYYLQQLAENKRKEHNKRNIKVIEPADETIYKELKELCKKFRIEHEVNDYFNDDRSFVVYLRTRLTPPEFSVEYRLLCERAFDAGITLESHDDRLCVLCNSNAPLLESTISLAEHVIFQEEGGSQNGEEPTWTINNVGNRMIEGVSMDQDDHVQTVEVRDAMDVVRNALPDGDCRVVFDIDRQLGPSYTDFSDQYGNQTPKKTHIAKFLGVTTRQIGVYRDNIRGTCLVHDFVPK